MRATRLFEVVALSVAALVHVHCGTSGDGVDVDAASVDARTPDSTIEDASVDAGTPDGAVDDATTSAADSAPTDDAGEASAGNGDAGPLDPQPLSCDGGGIPPVVGGTADCPDDKNLPGCPCTTLNDTAACWTGLRVNRDHGVCHDGTTTCTSSGGQLEWGACSGEQLPTGVTGKAACECFSSGHWQIDNLKPCTLTNVDGQGNSTTTIYASTPGTPATCPFDSQTFAPIVPAAWSTDTLTVDCTGSFSLCYTIKAGDPKNPQPTDCVIATTCTAPTHYGTLGVAMTFPDLPGWTSGPAQAACVQQFMNSGGYGVMSVQGQSDECEAIAKPFQSVTYCSPLCGGSNPPPSCVTCGAGGGGAF